MRQSAKGCVAAAASRRPFSRDNWIMCRRSFFNSSLASLMLAQTDVPTSTTDWCISVLTRSCRINLPFSMISA